MAGAAGDAGPVSLEILADVKQSQREHGLRHEDYGRYRQYCARRLRRLRKSTGLEQAVKRRYQKKELDAASCTSARHLQTVLVEAERAWAHAMELKEGSEEEPRQRRHMLARLRTAVRHGDRLSALCEADGVADQRTQMEAKAYVSFLSATLSLEKEEWEPALGNFVAARTVYEGLRKLGSPETQELMRLRVAEIEPSVRYCNYMLQRERGESVDPALLEQMAADAAGHGLAVLQSKLEHAIGDTLREQAATLDSVTHRGQAVPIRTEAMRVKVLTVREAENDVDRARRSPSSTTFAAALASYDRLFTAYADAIHDARAEADALRGTGTTSGGGGGAASRSQKSIGQEANLVLLEAFLSRGQLTRSVQRNELLLAATERRLEGASGSGGGSTGPSTKPEETAASSAADASTTPAASSSASSSSSSAAGSAPFFADAPTEAASVEDVVRCYDTLIVNMADLVQVCRAELESSSASASSAAASAAAASAASDDASSGASASVAEGDEERLKEATAKQEAFRAMRCFYLAVAHRGQSRFREASALLDRAAKEAQVARTQLDACSRPDTELQAQLASVEQRIRGTRCELHASRVLAAAAAARRASGEDEGPTATADRLIGAGTLAENQQRFDFSFAEKDNLAVFPPNFEAVPCKPVLFDLAGSLVSYPNMDAYAAKEPETPAAGGGWFSFLRRG